MGKDLHEKPFDDGTITKLEIFGKYLETWLPVFIMINSKKIYIVDFFAGPGKDKDGKDGSPLLIINKIRLYIDEIKSRQLEIKVIFNEYDSQKFEELERNIDAVRNELCFNPKLYNKDFKEIFNIIKPEFENNPALLIMDQNGIKHITKDILCELDKLNKTDFIFFISSSYFIRFSEDHSFKQYHPDFPQELLKGKSPNSVHRKILEYYRKMLPPESKLQLYPFSIKDTNSPNVHGLIFGSKHVLGVEKFLNIAWKKNEINGEANFDIDDDDFKKANRSLFPEHRRKTKIEVFEDDLQQFISDKKKVTNKEVYTFTLEKGFVHKHAADAIKQWIKEKKMKKNFEGKGLYIGYDQCCGSTGKTREFEWIV
jgi:three-Cys-motif partner protein